MLAVVTRQSSWSCPFKMNACCCSKCRSDTNNYKGGDPSQEAPEEQPDMKARQAEERKVSETRVVLEKRKRAQGSKIIFKITRVERTAEVLEEFEGYAPVRLSEYEDPWSSEDDPEFSPAHKSLYSRLYIKTD